MSANSLMKVIWAPFPSCIQHGKYNPSPAPAGCCELRKQGVRAPALVVEGFLPAEVGFHGLAPPLVRLQHHVVRLVEKPPGAGLGAEPSLDPRAGAARQDANGRVAEPSESGGGQGRLDAVRARDADG